MKLNLKLNMRGGLDEAGKFKGSKSLFSRSKRDVLCFSLIFWSFHKMIISLIQKDDWSILFKRHIMTVNLPQMVLERRPPWLESVCPLQLSRGHWWTVHVSFRPWNNHTSIFPPLHQLSSWFCCVLYVLSRNDKVCFLFNSVLFVLSWLYSYLHLYFVLKHTKYKVKCAEVDI